MDLNIKKIENELARLGWSKYRLAKEMRVANQTMYAVLDLNRKNGVTLKTVNNIAKALNMDPKDLLI